MSERRGEHHDQDEDRARGPQGAPADEIAGEPGETPSTGVLEIAASRALLGVRAKHLRVPDPGVEDEVEHVDGEVHEDEDRREEQHERLDQGVIAVRDRVDEQLP